MLSIKIETSKNQKMSQGRNTWFLVSIMIIGCKYPEPINFNINTNVINHDEFVKTIQSIPDSDNYSTIYSELANTLYTKYEININY